MYKFFFVLFAGQFVLLIENYCFLKIENSLLFERYRSEKDRFLYFIHEFHHFLSTNVEDQKDDLYILISSKNRQKNISTHNVTFKGTNDREGDFYIEIIKHKLAGYAAEEAFKRESFLLRLFGQDTPKETFSFFSLFDYSNNLISPLNDIQEAIYYVKKISLDNSMMKKYLEKYEEMKKKFLFIQEEEKKIIKYNFDINFYAQLKVLFILYEEFLQEYTKKEHQEKIYFFFKENPALLGFEIFFYTDLKSLWQKNKINRDLGDLKSFTLLERSIIDQHFSELDLKSFGVLAKSYKENSSFFSKIEKQAATLMPFFFEGSKKIISLFKRYTAIYLK